MTSERLGFRRSGPNTSVGRSSPPVPWFRLRHSSLHRSKTCRAPNRRSRYGSKRHIANIPHTFRRSYSWPLMPTPVRAYLPREPRSIRFRCRPQLTGLTGKPSQKPPAEGVPRADVAHAGLPDRSDRAGGRCRQNRNCADRAAAGEGKGPERVKLPGHLPQHDQPAMPCSAVQDDAPASGAGAERNSRAMEPGV